MTSMNGSIARKIVGSILAVVIAMAASAVAQQPTSNQPVAAPNGIATNRGSGMGEGIQVHGDWVIEIKNPDGSRVLRREFRNGLYPQWGAGLIVNLLMGRGIPGSWHIMVSEDIYGYQGPCGSGCLIAEPRFTHDTPFDNLRISIPSGRTPEIPVSFQGEPSWPTGSFQLAGQASATRDSTVREVGTRVMYINRHGETTLCPEETSMRYGLTDCFGNLLDSVPLPFTSKTLDPPIEVRAGQLIQVSVTLSFTTAITTNPVITPTTR